MELGEIPVIGGVVERGRKVAKSATGMGIRAIGGAIEGALYDPAHLEQGKFEDIIKWLPVWEAEHIAVRAEGEALMGIPQSAQDQARGEAQNYAEHFARFYNRRDTAKREDYAVKLAAALIVCAGSIEEVNIDPVCAEVWRADLRNLVTRAEEPLPISEKMLPYLIPV